MTSKNTKNQSASLSQASTDQQSINDSESPSSQSSIASINHLIDAQIVFTQHWLQNQAQQLMDEAWQWLSDQPMSQYISADDLQRLINEWLLSQPMSEVMRTDIRAILQTLIYHPINDNVPLSELIDDTQVHTLATYIGRHEQQRNGLIHALIGNDTFADLLTQTLYHAINDFMEGTLDKAGGVGKLMKMGRSSFEKATNRSLDEKLQTYLHRNIKDLAGKAEANAQSHLSNEEVSRLLITGWSRIKDLPISHVQTYLDADPDNNSIDQLEAGVQQSYNRLRIAPYLHSLVTASVETWYANHQSDTIGAIAASLHIDEQAIAQLNKTLLPIVHNAIYSTWITAHIRKVLQEFYEQPNIKDKLSFDS